MLDSLLMQKTNFDFEVLIHDDASTDGTTDILKEYEEKYPKIIHPTYEHKNKYSTGNYDFINDLFREAKGKYIAFCEGDDFWTSDEKLQKQVDFLQSHKDYAICFHPVRVFFEEGEEPDSLYPEETDPKYFTITNLLRRNFIQSNSVMYRAKTYESIPSTLIPSDWYMHLYHAQDGKIGFINEVMSAYRRQSGGVWWDSFKDVSLIWKKYGLQHLELYVELLKLYSKKPLHIEILRQHIEDIVAALIRTDSKYGTNLLEQATRNFPEDIAIVTDTIFHRNTLLQTQIAQKEDELNKTILRLNEEKEVLHHRDLELRLIKNSKLWKVRDAVKASAKRVLKK